MRPDRRSTAGVALALTVCWTITLGVSGATDALFYLFPALLIFAPLVAGRYIGEELIAKLAARRDRPRPARAIAAPRRAIARTLPRGTGLIAFSLAERPPPALLGPIS
jgi:hypothetical protein